MRRVIEATRHQARWWNLVRSARQGHVSPTDPVDEELAEGLNAYADEHADMETAIADSFEAQWAVIRQKAREYLKDTDVGGQSQSSSDRVEVVQVEIDVASEVEESGSEDDER